MKKILQWIASSFFRQFGRFLFFLVLGGLVVLLLQNNEINFKQFKWTDLLGIETVKAVTYTTEVHAESSSFFNFTGVNYNFTCDDWDKCYTNLISSTSGTLNNIEINIDTSYNTINKDVVEFKTIVSQPKQVMGTTAVYYCDTWTQQNSGSYACTHWYNTTNYYYVPVNELGSYSMSAQVQYSNTNWAFCDITNGSILCPTYHNQITKLKINYSFMSTDTNTNNSTVRFTLYKIANNLFYDKTSSAIENQTQQQQQQHNETIGIITDTNTTDDISSTSNFFNDTNITSENSLVSIASTPIDMINSLVVGNYNSICATLNGKQICLPSGSIIWQRNSNGSSQSHGGSGVHDTYQWFSGGTTENFISFFNLVVGGYILYRCLISLLRSIHKALDPADTYIEVMKL